MSPAARSFVGFRYFDGNRAIGITLEPGPGAVARTSAVSSIERKEMMVKYGKKAQAKVKKVMHERKTGKLHSGSSGKKVKSRKQAIAIGLSEARREGDKVPPKKTAKKSVKKSTKKTPAKKSATKKRATKKSTAKKTST